MQTVPTVVRPLDVALRDAPIPAQWIIDGNPQTMSREVARTDDGSTQVFVWQTTAGRFNWHYAADEVVTVLDGEVFLTDETGAERRLGPQDVAFFPKGSSAVWRVPDHVRKVATLKRVVPEPFAGLIRWLRMVKNSIKPEPTVSDL